MSQTIHFDFFFSFFFRKWQKKQTKKQTLLWLNKFLDNPVGQAMEKDKSLSKHTFPLVFSYVNFNINSFNGSQLAKLKK